MATKHRTGGAAIGTSTWPIDTREIKGADRSCRRLSLLWLRNRMPEKRSNVQKHVVQPKYQSSEEILAEIHTKLIEMEAEGYLESHPVPALPAPKEE